MPDNNSPHVIGKDDLVMARRAHASLKRRWTCPGDQTIAAFIDGAVRLNEKRRVEIHLASCERCRLIVADVVKLQREIDLPVPPTEVARKGAAFAPTIPARSPLIWAPAAAMALLVLIAAIFGVLRQPQKLLVASPPTPSAPTLAKAEPPALGHAPVREITRKPHTPEIAPVILSPLQGSAVTRNHFQIMWKPVSRVRYYKVSVVGSDGNLLWEGQTEKSNLRPPADIQLTGGPYFVWITAYLNDGQVAKCAPVRFTVEP